jgi:nifR3 family TIM-barrel protein
MVASDALVRGHAEAALRADGRGITPHVVQLAGCEAHWLGEAARMAEASGAAIIDINMGCPAKRVTNGWAGSALMRDLDHACRLIEATVGAVSVPVTLKMRLGWDEQSLNAPELASHAVALGVAMITVHGRTRSQFYKGSASWSAVRAVRQAIAVPLVVNGDVASLQDAREALVQSGADAVMIGRAAMGRPWMVGEIGRSLSMKGENPPALDADTMAGAAVEHYESLLASMGRDVGVRHARKHVAAYADEAARLGSARAVHGKGAALTTDDPRVVIRELRAMFQDLQTFAPPIDEHDRRLEMRSAA